MDVIASMPGMQNIQIDIPLAWNIVSTESPVHHASGYRFYPDKVKGEGFFITVFQKQAAFSNGYYNNDFKWNAITKQENAVLSSHFLLPEHHQCINHQNTLLAIPSLFESPIKALLKNLYVKKLGIDIGEIKGKDLIPAHALAMSNWDNLPYGRVQVDEPTALQYLRRADLILEGEKGWQAVYYQNIRLGWAKLLPNRTNNYYPPAWRILKY